METAHDPFDELTSLYLGGAPGTSPVAPVTMPESIAREEDRTTDIAVNDIGVTVALCGHLPVMAGLWVTQYAEKIAAAHGPTGLVRLEGGRCLLEILRPDAKTTDLAENRRPVDLLEHVSQLAAGRIRRWIVCVDDRDAAASVRAGAEEVVILTAADKPAVIEAYRLAKSAAARVADPDSLELGLVLVGMDDDKAENLSERLAPVTARHLDRELPVRATVRRIDVVEGSIRQVFDEASRVPAEEVVEAILEAISVAASVRSEEDEDPWSSVVPPASDGPRLRIATDDALEEIRQPIRLAPAPVLEEPAVDEREIVMSGLEEAPGEVEESIPVMEASSVTSDPDVEGEGLSDLLGLRAVDWHLPNAGGVEYACDADGRLHLLAMDGDVTGLHVAAAWIGGQQRQFAAASGLDAESVGDPCLHVITEHPPRVADLHRTGLHLHLLTKVGPGAVLVPLNDESNRTSG